MFHRRRLDHIGISHRKLQKGLPSTSRISFCYTHCLCGAAVLLSAQDPGSSLGLLQLCTGSPAGSLDTSARHGNETYEGSEGGHQQNIKHQAFSSSPSGASFTQGFMAGRFFLHLQALWILYLRNMLFLIHIKTRVTKNSIQYYTSLKYFHFKKAYQSPKPKK